MLKYKFLFIFIAISSFSLIAAIILEYIYESHWLWVSVFSFFFIGCFTTTLLFINRFKKDYLSNAVDQKQNYNTLTQELSGLKNTLSILLQKSDFQHKNTEETKQQTQRVNKLVEDLLVVFTNTTEKLTYDFATQLKKQTELEQYVRNEGLKQTQNSASKLQKAIVDGYEQIIEKLNESTEKNNNYVQTIKDETRNIEFSLSQEINILSKQLDNFSSTSQKSFKEISQAIDNQENNFSSQLSLKLETYISKQQSAFQIINNILEDLSKQFSSTIEPIASEQQSKSQAIYNLIETYQKITQESIYQKFEAILTTIESYKFLENFANFDRKLLTNELLLNKAFSKIELAELQNLNKISDIDKIKQLLEVKVANNLQQLHDITIKNTLELVKIQSELDKTIQHSSQLLSLRSDLENGLKAAIISQSSEGISTISKIFDLQLAALNLNISNNFTTAKLQNSELEKAQNQSTEQLRAEILKLTDYISQIHHTELSLEQKSQATTLQHIDQLNTTSKQNFAALKTDIEQTILNPIKSLSLSTTNINEQIEQLHSSVTTQTEAQKNNTAEILKYSKDIFNSIVRRININTNQVEAFVGLYSTIKPNLPLPQMRGWAISPDIANKLIMYLLSYKPKTIVNIGCGLSDIVLSYAIKQHNLDTKIISLEADAKFLEITQTNLSLHQLNDVVTLVHAPLINYKINDKDWLWYDLNNLTNQSIDMLFIDGPPGATQKMARYPALPLLKKYLSPNPLIILDDAIRQEEKDIAKLWITENPEFTSEYFEDEKGTIVLKKQ